MKLESLKKKKIAILGFGKEGESLLKFLFKAGVKDVTVLDQKEDLDKTWIEKLGIGLEAGKNYLKNVQDFDLIFRSPGVPLDMPALGPVRSKLSSPTKLFFELVPTKNIIGVTGTKGKSTAAALTAHLLKRKYPRTFLAGNIGSPMLDLLPSLKKSDWVVLELSSFQLEDLTVSPKVSILLNLTPEHLYRHGSFQKYTFAKSTIFRYQSSRDYLITNYDHFILRRLAGETRSQIIFISSKEPLKKGVFIQNNKIISTLSGKRTILELSDVPLLGKHNLENVLPAVAAAIILGVSPRQIQQAMRHFKPLPHRLEKVGEKMGIIFVDDSIATTPESSLAGAESFDKPLAVIAGGSTKGADFADWAKGLAKSQVVMAALIGQEAPKMESALKRFAPRIKRVRCSTLLSAVKESYKALKGRAGVILLSPACASFDMFQNFAERGDRFKEIVRNM
jgi:UDP-N-acetylmuramoylalanine--D-glutamate ligase